jgi:YHS domain-containing protein
VVSNKKLTNHENPVMANHQGRKIYFHDEKARDLFKAKPEAFLAKYDQALMNAQASMYPLDYCVVTGTKFSKEKKPVNYLHDGRLVRFCCPSLVPKFKENHKEYMAKLDKAIIDQQLAAYPLDTCLVSNTKLDQNGEKSFNHIFSNMLVRLSCQDCVKKFDDNPLKYMPKIMAAMPHPQKEKVKSKAIGAATSKPAKKSGCYGSCGGKAIDT